MKWRVTKHARVLKNKKRLVFFSAYLFGFLLFFFDSSSHYVSLTSWHLLLFWGVMCVPEFFGDQWTEYNIGHVQNSGFRRKQLVLLNVFDLILLFLWRFLICFIFFFYPYPYLFFLKLWFTFFLWYKCSILDFWRPKNAHSFSLHISLDFCFLSILHFIVFLQHLRIYYFFLFYVCSWIFWWSMKCLFIFFLYFNPDFVDAIF